MGLDGETNSVFGKGLGGDTWQNGTWTSRHKKRKTLLAGRHKRNWIRDRIDQEATTAVALYRQAYAIAVEKNDAAQAYYHGINLAFLALVYEDDSTKARDFAKKVLSHCEDAATDEKPDNRMWDWQRKAKPI